MTDYIKSLRKPFVIVGLGKSGEAAKRLLLLSGVNSQDIITFDSKAPANYSDPVKLQSEIAPQTYVVSPGVPLQTDWLQIAKKQGCTITSEINLACSVLKNEKIISITGSLGKSTTISALGAAALVEDVHAFVGGNLGTPLATYAADVLEGRKRASWVLLELSSYQLENCENLISDYSAITYLTPNHMERYTSLEEYYLSKWSLFLRTKTMAFINSFGGDLLSWSKGRVASAPVIAVKTTDDELKPLDLQTALLIGRHNQENLALAARIGLSAGWSSKSLLRLNNFSGLEHRLENLGLVNKVRIINDSKGTAIDSVLTAVHASVESSLGGKIYLLLGGRDKNLPWEDLHSLTEFTDLIFIFFGESRETVKSKSKLNGTCYSTLSEALPHVFRAAHANDTILLSPGGTSLDEFKSFEDRGNYFKNFAYSFNK